MSPTPAVARPALGLGWQARAEGKCAPACLLPHGCPPTQRGLGKLDGPAHSQPL